ncbi:MAG: hypothetical protein U9R50_02235, partial [Campylobacterota bacterium]|nr:hypothetical protein [Campylobacterota bacterium]
RWERGSTKPSMDKQIKIVHLFSELGNTTLSCFNTMDKKLVETELCKLGIQNLVGHSKEHILNFPTKSFRVDDISIEHLRSADDIDTVLQMPYSVIENLTGNVYNLNFETIKSWAEHPSNLFLLSKYQGQFYGLLFALRLKPDIFQKIIDFTMNIKDINDNDFAGFDEMGSNFPIAFFAYNDKSSTLMMLRYYAHLIANQDIIAHVGTTPLLDGAKKIVQKMHLKHYKDKKVTQGLLSSYSAPLSDVLINEAVLKMIFQKQICPEDID